MKDKEHIPASHGVKERINISKKNFWKTICQKYSGAMGPRKGLNKREESVTIQTEIHHWAGCTERGKKNISVKIENKKGLGTYPAEV